MEHVANRVIGISAVSGGGKTALTRRLAELLQDSAALYFDDYDGSSVIPDFLPWFEDGADYDAFKTPVFTDHIRSLKAGYAVTYPGGSKIEPAKYILVDAPLGRVHADSGRYIDFMVFIDTPLDIAMARRLSRGLALESDESSAEIVAGIKADADGYPARARQIYVAAVERTKPTCDLVLDGTKSLDELASAVISSL
jgi:uridine kinase